MIMSAIINNETTELANITKRPNPRFTLMAFIAVTVKMFMKLPILTMGAHFLSLNGSFNGSVAFVNV